jgi:catechol 2,3-dioxygenase-like lactoylglutathione lyase family enzyme
VADPILKQLDLIFYWVSDMDRAVSFYRDLLGLRLVRRDEDTWVEFESGGRRLALHSVAEGQPMTPGGATAVFSVDDLDRAKADLSSRGVRFGHEGDVAGFARFASFLDSEGNTVQLIEYEGREPTSSQPAP